MDLTIGIIFLFPLTAGILGNFSLIIHYGILYLRGCRSRPTDLILRHLAGANSLFILSKGFLRTMPALGLTHFLSDLTCIFLLYVERVARGVSICSTCLLSVFQAITISPLHSRWAGLKLKVLKYIGPSNILCWTLHMLVNAIFPIYMVDKWSNTTITKTNMPKYCSTKHYDNVSFSLYVALVSSHDVICLGFMSWASGSMVFILYKHKRQIRHIYNNMTHRYSAETTANKSILVLVSIYVLFYALSSIIYAYLAYFGHSSQWLANTSVFLSMCFPTVSPFVLMNNDPCIARLWSVCYRTNP